MTPGSGVVARGRIALCYVWRHRRLPNLAAPTRLTELVQLRKLTNRDPRLPALADKVAVKAHVARELGREWVIPLLWSGAELPAQPLIAGPVVVKSRHGCNQTAFVRDPGRDWAAARSASARWMRAAYGRWLDEWLYSEIPRGLLIEPLIGGGALPIDYKVFVFGGFATHVEVHLDRERNHRWYVHDRGWRPLAADTPAIPRPTRLPAMLSAAEHLAAGFDFARVDFYQPDRQPLFGEISFYPGSGLEPIDPPELDRAWGQLWLAASAKAAAREPSRFRGGRGAVLPTRPDSALGGGPPRA
ncbi:MAG: ATP-grasp fold amidoligase family protein [Sphingomonadaceae bacterium]|nr:ATP-grasp fold amidoligase family protein [Sphingomonadaceae bacterium]